MESTKPYLIRAIHEWCSDQGFTPYLSVTVDETTRVPTEFVRDGNIVLNVGLEATHQLELGNDEITFQARFGGRAFPVRVPIARVQAIYARENGQGMAFEVTEVETEEEAVGKRVPKASGTSASRVPKTVPKLENSETEESPPVQEPSTGRSHLKRIK